MSEPATNATSEAPRATIPIWAKMAAALIVPLLAVAGMSLVQIKHARDKVASVDRETGLASVALAPGGLVDSLIVERGDATLTVVGIRNTATFPTASFAESIAATDTGLASLTKAVDGRGPDAQKVFGPTLKGMGTDLAGLRKQVKGSLATADLRNWDLSTAIYDDYTVVIAKLAKANSDLSAAISDPELRAAADTLSDVNHAHDTVSDLTRAVGTALAPAPKDNPNGPRDTIVVSLAAYVKARANLAADTNGPWAPQARAYGANKRYDEIATQAVTFLKTRKVNLSEYIKLNPAVSQRVEAPMGTTQAVAQKATKSLQGFITAKRKAARDEERNYLLLSIGIFLGAAALAAAIARSVTNPMRSLTRQAEAMAAVHLPQAVQSVLETAPGTDVVVPQVPPVAVKSRDELQTVATALNHVQTSALDLAVEQATLRRNIADSFVSLGRRTQNLIGLQLELITDLEAEETDSGALESLYRLDHLATRARRNAESLVVLGGTESNKAGGAPVPMTDVVRATLSEVEAYQRVEINAVAPAMIGSNIAADLIHLMAELVENGLAFSPPNKSVEVVGTSDASGYTLTVTDHGVGMDAARLEQANRRLSDNETFTVAPSRYLGHYVAGKLAARIGATVKLAPGSGDGVVATVHMPTALLGSDKVTPGDAAPASGNVPKKSRLASSGQGPGQTDDESPGSDSAAAKVDGRPPTFAEATQATADHRHDQAARSIQTDAAVEPEITDGGLRKRVPGQHAKVSDRSPLLRSAGVNRDDDTPSDLGAQTSPEESQNLASLLNAYTSGVEKGQRELAQDADANGPDDSETT